jgi:pyruvate,water dikinase
VDAGQRTRTTGNDAATPADTGQSLGGKGRNLKTLTAAGLPVPRWGVVVPAVFTRYLRRHGLSERLGGLLALAVAEPPGTIAEDTIAEELTAPPLDAEFVAAVDTAYAAAGGGLVAVRSSALDEDGAEHSFAGQFDSFLNVGAPDVAEYVRRCFVSTFSERSSHYRRQRGLGPPDHAVAVIVQEMVPAERSGVLFTANPVTGDTGQYVVSACYGLGEGLVSGAVDADTVVLDAGPGARVSVTVGDKRQRFHPGDGPGCAVEDVPEADRMTLALTDRDLVALSDAGAKVTALFAAPQDVEWAIVGDRLSVLQSRPITNLPAPPAGELRIWDNSNIIESFSGITSQLTYTFAASAYGKVYEHYAKALRVPADQLRQMAEWTPTMLGYFHGRVYYHLFHWYRMVRLAPLYRLNRRVLEAAVGVEEPLDDDLLDTLHPYTFPSASRRRWAKLVMTAEFTRRFLTMHRSVDRFSRDFYRAYEVFNNVDYDALPGDETYRRLRRLERDLIEDWGPMMTLDATLLLSVGALALLTRRWLPDAPQWLAWAAAGPGAQVESAAPARALSELAARVRADPALRELLERTPPDQVYPALRDGGHPEFLAAVEEYLAEYGYRSPDELKLEVPDLTEDPSGLFVMVRGALPGIDTGRDEQAQDYLDAHLRGPRRWLYEVVRRNTAKLLADRERLRFCRTRAFGAAKRMLRAMGRDLARTGAIADWRDVFHLRLDEVRGAYEGTIAHAELPHLVSLRKRLLAEDAALVAPSRFRTRGAPYWQGNLERGGWTARSVGRTGARELRGTPSCPGVVQGRAVVTDTPCDAGGGILVTYRTDPGWVPALSSASALIIERGSPLTHVAVVAREFGVPTVVGVRNATSELTTGMRIRLDGTTGLVTVLDDGPDDDPAAEGGA